MNKNLLLTVLLLGSGVACLADEPATNDTMSLEQEMDLVTTIAQESETKDVKKDETKKEDTTKKSEEAKTEDVA